MENLLLLCVPILKHITVTEKANSVDLDAADKEELPSLKVHSLSSRSLLILNMI